MKLTKTKSGEYSLTNISQIELQTMFAFTNLHGLSKCLPKPYGEALNKIYAVLENDGYAEEENHCLFLDGIIAYAKTMI